MKAIVCIDTGEVCKTYDEYMKSNHWSIMKVKYHASDRPKRCGICDTKDRLDLHHQTYDRIGNELLSDLIYLCHECHIKAHYFMRGKTNYQIETLNTPKRQQRKPKTKSKGKSGYSAMTIEVIGSPKKKKRKAESRKRRFDNWYGRNCGPVITYNLNDVNK